jgi:hypothetical protein
VEARKVDRGAIFARPCTLRDRWPNVVSLRQHDRIFGTRIAGIVLLLLVSASIPETMRVPTSALAKAAPQPSAVDGSHESQHQNGQLAVSPS